MVTRERTRPNIPKKKKAKDDADKGGKRGFGLGGAIGQALRCRLIHHH